MRRVSVVVVAVLAAVVSGLAAAAQPAKTDLSGFWNLAREKVKPDPDLMRRVAPNTAVLEDTGAAEFGSMEFGGLKLKPAALAHARAWQPKDDMTVSTACRVPSIIYAMQGPFPIEISQGTELIVIRLEYFDMARVIFMDGRPDQGPKAPHTKTGFSRGHWEGDVLVVETTHLKEATITNNGLDHSDNDPRHRALQAEPRQEAAVGDAGVRGSGGARQSRRALHRVDEGGRSRARLRLRSELRRGIQQALMGASARRQRALRAASALERAFEHHVEQLVDERLLERAVLDDEAMEDRPPQRIREHVHVHARSQEPGGFHAVEHGEPGLAPRREVTREQQPTGLRVRVTQRQQLADQLAGASAVDARRRVQREPQVAQRDSPVGLIASMRGATATRNASTASVPLFVHQR